jgi:hypothetical protein
VNEECEKHQSEVGGLQVSEIEGINGFGEQLTQKVRGR